MLSVEDGAMRLLLCAVSQLHCGIVVPFWSANAIGCRWVAGRHTVWRALLTRRWCGVEAVKDRSLFGMTPRSQGARRVAFGRNSGVDREGLGFLEPELPEDTR